MAKKSLELAKRIINLGSVLQQEIYGRKEKIWSVNLDHVVGMSFGSKKKSKGDAVEDMAKQLASALDNGELVLSDDWEKTYLGKSDEE